MQAIPTLNRHPSGVLLSDQPSSWPPDAKRAYRDLLSELNAWCRETGCHSRTNDRVAMRAVREVWQEATPW